jgi:hypothetical protein
MEFIEYYFTRSRLTYAVAYKSCEGPTHAGTLPVGAPLGNLPVALSLTSSVTTVRLAVPSARGRGRPLLAADLDDGNL